MEREPNSSLANTQQSKILIGDITFHLALIYRSLFEVDISIISLPPPPSQPFPYRPTAAVILQILFLLQHRDAFLMKECRRRFDTAVAP